MLIDRAGSGSIMARKRRGGHTFAHPGDTDGIGRRATVYSASVIPST